MKLTNDELQARLQDITGLCAPTNRLPVRTSLRARRTLRALRSAWAPVEEVRIALVQEHGKQDKAGNYTVQPGTPQMAAFLKDWLEVLAEEVEVEVEPIRLSEVEAGWSRDKETGEKDILDVSPTCIGNLLDCGLIEDDTR